MNIRPRLMGKTIFKDIRGKFCESFNKSYWDSKGINFVADYVSWSRKKALRGLHYQTVEPQGKLVSVVNGSIYDFCVDVRDNDPNTFGHCYWFILLSESFSLWIPPGFAHGYISLENGTIVTYKTTSHRHAKHEVVIRYDDPSINLAHCIKHRGPFILSEKDKAGIWLKDAPRVRI